ncbi:hypothetical protein BABINDRAFT_163285 [Babjeviella inositovora NRRL Y-12698]|uniref:D-xylose reductase [NAD(P)H] n=1 Tax=Babjeviella inositovora NRRL Y-12698 TaxID=984486 RepID=A0A1E3QKC6_9ASCO|nr:uncharacterized protein BABINDRAFT_163285 [Babjeviella inositovora NRRL Y-12698]ODQ77914.1 hypothetical protein BABINDRAFT_163285 [Babjeviella inositovora NRRL Y-12698]
MSPLSSTVKLNSGHLMPLVGFGCWKVNNSTAADQIYNAIKTGYRAFDGAQDYGNEKEVGDGIKRAIADGLVKREELFIISKLWNNFHKPANAKIALKRTLSDLQLDYVDLFYIHFPIAFSFVSLEEKYPPGFYCGDGDNFKFENVSLAETWGALESFVDEGLVKSIGISNFNGALVYDLLRTARIRPAALQIEHHPYLVQDRLVEYVQSQGIQIVGYSSFGPQSFLELGHATAKDTPTLFEHSTIKSIANKHSKSTAQVLLRWATQRNIAVIPKSNNPERLLANLTVEDFDLSKEEIAAISALDANIRFNNPWDWNNAKIPIFV